MKTRVKVEGSILWHGDWRVNFSEMTPRSLAEIIDISDEIATSIFRAYYRVRMLLQNVRKCLPEYKASFPRRQKSSKLKICKKLSAGLISILTLSLFRKTKVGLGA
jgi:hypothetical protein